MLLGVELIFCYLMKLSLQTESSALLQTLRVSLERTWEATSEGGRTGGRHPAPGGRSSGSGQGAEARVRQEPGPPSRRSLVPGVSLRGEGHGLHSMHRVLLLHLEDRRLRALRGLASGVPAPRAGPTGHLGVACPARPCPGLSPQGVGRRWGPSLPPAARGLHAPSPRATGRGAPRTWPRRASAAQPSSWLGRAG